MSAPDAAGEEPAPTDARSRDVHFTLPCTDGASSCVEAKACAVDLAYGLDTGEGSPGVHVFIGEPDAVAYVRSLGFQGALTGGYVEFTAGSDPYVFAPLLNDSAFVVVDGAVAPDVYGSIVRYAQCPYPQDAAADAEDAATE